MSSTRFPFFIFNSPFKFSLSNFPLQIKNVNAAIQQLSRSVSINNDCYKRQKVSFLFCIICYRSALYVHYVFPLSYCPIIKVSMFGPVLDITGTGNYFYLKNSGNITYTKEKFYLNRLKEGLNDYKNKTRYSEVEAQRRRGLRVVGYSKRNESRNRYGANMAYLRT